MSSSPTQVTIGGKKEEDVLEKINIDSGKKKEGKSSCCYSWVNIGRGHVLSMDHDDVLLWIFSCLAKSTEEKFLCLLKKSRKSTGNGYESGALPPHLSDSLPLFFFYFNVYLTHRGNTLNLGVGNDSPFQTGPDFSFFLFLLRWLIS